MGKNIISIFGSHNAAIAVAIKGQLKEVIEIERFINTKNASLSFYIIHPSKEEIVKLALAYINKRYGIIEWDVCLFQRSEGLERLIKANEYRETKHHESHAAGSFYQSNYQEAIVISFDGGGNDGFFNIYNAERHSGLELKESIELDLGVPYSIIGEFLAPIKKEENILIGNVVYSGKIMGLAAFGVVRESWKSEIRSFFLEHSRFDNYKNKCLKLLRKLNLTLENERVEIPYAADLAATFQVVFEELFFQTISKYHFANANLVVTGGCAMNILLNYKLKEKYSNLFIAPNSSDCGIATGMILNEIKPVVGVDVTYMGSPVYDQDSLAEFISTYNGKNIDLTQVSEKLHEGQIIGLVQNTSEHGARALGNRSILCNPMIRDMKDVLNQKVKNREFYRPFAAVCLLDNAHEYFEVSPEEEYRWMSYSVEVKSAYRGLLRSVTHLDGTCRLQTVTRSQNELLYALLTEFGKLSGYPILLNTSFNIAGKPILNTYRDAIWMLENTQMDGLVLQDYFLEKRE